MKGKYDLAILVVIYNKKFSESSTLCKLFDALKENKKVCISIWNNGPVSLNNEFNNLTELNTFNNIDVLLNESLHNESLSVIYNSFIKSVSSKVFVFFDDDSIPSDEYLLELRGLGENSIGLPLIVSGSRALNPKVNGVVISSRRSLKISDTVITIGSGLAIGENILRNIKDKYGDYFDLRFYFYGVDSTFMYRINSLKINNTIVVLPKIEHSISINIIESEYVSSFRRKERSYDIGLQLRFYNDFPVSIFKLLFFTLKELIKRNGSYYKLSYIYKSFVFGKHYRN